jgi:hypothetical protein
MTSSVTFKCELCNGYASCFERPTRAHMSREHLVCWSAANPCMQQFNSRKELAKHWILTSHAYYCHVCDGGYHSKDEFATHDCSPQEDISIKCSVCEMIAPNQEVYDKHWEDTTQDSRHFRCDQCRRIFRKENHLKMVHLSTPPNPQHHTLTTTPLQHAQTHLRPTISCFHCQNSFSSHSNLFRHMEVSCPHINKDTLHSWLQSVSPSRSCAFPAYMDEPQPYFCRGCERTFNDLGSLAAHVEMSGICPATVDSVYFKGVIGVVNGGEICSDSESDY